MFMTTLDWIIIASYILFALGVGYWFSGRASKSTDEYFLSGRCLPWWVLGTSMVATTFAADTPLAITEFVRQEGVWRNWFWWNVALQGMVATFLFAPLWRRAEVTTDQELIELRYGGRPAAWLRAFKAGYFAVFLNCLILSWVIAGMTTVVSVLMNVDKHVAVLACLAVALVYSVVSGFWGVVVTDLVQFVIAAGGAIILAVAAVSHVGGMEALLAKLPAKSIAILPPLEHTDNWLMAPWFKVFIYLTVVWWASQNIDGGGYIIQRMSAAKDESHALLGTLWFNLCNYAVRSWPWVIVALVSLVIHPDLSTHAFGDKAGYPLVIAAVLGPGFRGLLVVSFLAAFMSTVDTHLNWGASYLVSDIYRRFICPKATPEHYVKMAKVCVVILMLIAGLSSLMVKSISGLWEFVWALGCGLGPVLVLRWFWWRINAWSEITALASSVAATLLLKLSAYLWPKTQLLGIPISNIPVHLKILIVLPISISCWLLVTFLTKSESKETLERFCRRVNPGGFWADFTPKVSAHRPILGWTALANWICGLALVYGATFAIGLVIFGRYSYAIMSAIMFVAGAFGLLKLYPDTKAKSPAKS